MHSRCRAETLTISLRLGTVSRIMIGRTSDSTDASIIAAGLGTITDKPVVEL